MRAHITHRFDWLVYLLSYEPTFSPVKYYLIGEYWHMREWAIKDGRHNL